jgi:hypothetical protein
MGVMEVESFSEGSSEVAVGRKYTYNRALVYNEPVSRVLAKPRQVCPKRKIDVAYFN